MKFRLVILIIVFSSFTIHAQDIVGTWNGVLSIPGREFKLVFHINKSDNGYHSTMDSPQQSTYGIESNSTEYIDSILSIEILSAGIKYNGKLKENQIVGTFYQGGQSFPLNLVKGEIEEEAVKRPQEPSEPFPYLSEDIKFENKKDNVQLAGTLTLPGKDGNYPAVVLISGSGQQNRDSQIFGHKPFLVLANYLTKKGFAVLRYDDRGFAESTGDARSATTFDFAKDTEAAINYLKSREEIDKEKIGLIGHSEGGIIAPIIASRNEDVAFIVMLAGPTLPGNELILLQTLKSNKAMGLTNAVVEFNQKIIQETYNVILDETIDSKKVADSLANYYLKNYGNLLPDENRKQMCTTFSSPWMITYIKTNPAEYLLKVNCPTLALFGSKDLQVPSTENIKVLESIKKESENKDIKIIELQNLNHLFQECETGLPGEYTQIAQTISPVALEEILMWLKDVVK